MKTITKDNPTSRIDIHSLKISTSELTDLVFKTLPKDKLVTLTLGRKFDQQYTILEGRAEISENAASIAMPFIIECEGIEIKFDELWGVTISYSSTEQPIALSLKNRLTEFRTFRKKYFDNHKAALALWFFTMLLIFFIDEKNTTPLVVIHLIFYMSLGYLMLDFVLSLLSKDFIVYNRERQNFWIRNKDSLLMLLVGGFLGAFFTSFERVLTYFKGL